MTEDEDNRKPFPSPWTDIAERPTPYDDYTAAVEVGRMAGGMGRLGSRSPRFARLLIVLVIMCIGLVVTVFAMAPPWDDMSASEPAWQTHGLHAGR